MNGEPNGFAGMVEAIPADDVEVARVFPDDAGPTFLLTFHHDEGRRVTFSVAGDAAKWLADEIHEGLSR